MPKQLSATNIVDAIFKKLENKKRNLPIHEYLKIDLDLWVKKFASKYIVKESEIYQELGQRL